VPTLTKVTLEPARAETAVLGPAGGTLEVTDAAGTTYLLEVAPGALWEETSIVAAPLNSIAGLPPSAEVAAGLHLTPEGLLLRDAATLTITRRAAVQRATLGFAYRDDLEDPFRYPAGRNSQSAVFRITHFSGYGLLQATEPATTVEELGLAIPWEPPDGAADRALGEIAAVIDSSGPNRNQAINEALRRWLDDGLAPLADEFGQMNAWNEGEFFELGVRIRSDLALWDYVAALATLVGVTIGSVLTTRVSNLAVAVGSHAVQVTNSNCIASPPAVLALLRIPEIGGWLGWAAERGISQRDESLGAAFVADNLCVAVRFLPTGGVVFPESVQPGQTGTLALAVGLQVNGVAEVHAIGRYDVKVVPTGTSPGGDAIGSTDDVGRWSRDFTWAPGGAGLRLDIDACLPAPLGSVCDAETVTRGATPTGTVGT
jgi:hypothetical protein